ncbi:undecaprenyl-diphosphate phosphatase [Aestuariirhabdus sp. Z084]|uniref:undecaprenyl-diphosphate phosphatase n=1 Tax=Aestuariirhabdus haliotis TaxID=2918751 RepID=UPI00201B3CD6|nr:undecaprenyl-diphosphate phosphatase [Aestuariirhabdus haliotis]MCL6417136.1 undecaprenyl-diphosphate phosphatase [Aestuariirhabdus haliotis]MCL6421132.1 undecaprenyl-diphosphate phosphatase [Aestuariirhabdus haliotis]
MDVFQIIVLALIQGISEFLPISSSAHLILPSQILGWADQGLAFDVAVHIGSLAAVVTYFRHDLVQLISGCQQSLVTREINAESRLSLMLVLGTIPAVLFGLVVSVSGFDDAMRSIFIIATTTLIFGVLLGFAERFIRGESMDAMGWKQALLIGIAQALAIIPGTSRSGITITAALLLGFSREVAARFSFLLSIPIIVAAGTLKIAQLIQQADPVDWSVLVLGVLLSGVSAWLCIKWFLAVINRIGMMPFVIYRIVLAGVLFAIYFN